MMTSEKTGTYDFDIKKKEHYMCSFFLNPTVMTTVKNMKPTYVLYIGMS